ncbi:siderophore-interacting protein [Stenotrophomonas mori]|uniref:Siderophore-interacting protein n=1 Tax=Stenotrophomonas mori TaxID=2871096 RepID=A0ABT0SHA1_9GAMM|nr:siderophore-interacting protein [Stenotrophomonas mori]MCL7714380.1 siderophore-interacting protein [Stenotrophomonas mori]
MAERSPYRLFHVQLKQRIALSPSMVRMVLTAPEVAHMRSDGPDQRIKVFFPLPGQSAPQVPEGEDWYARYRALGDDERPPMRTYTIRALRRGQAEVDVDFVMHGETGPASRWAVHARPGDRIALMAPDAEVPDPQGMGYEWKPPADAGEILLVADETALPAVAGILETLAGQSAPPRVRALLEVAHGDDVQPLKAPEGAQLVWCVREGAGYGEELLQAVKSRIAPLAGGRGAAGTAPDLAEVDIDTQILWEQAAGTDAAPFYAWVAGEAGAVMAIRRYLVKECGLDRSTITFMGYWRHGKVLE